jgi:hypothetical protein
VFLIRPSLLVENLFSGVDAGMVGFVIDQKQGQIGYDALAGVGVAGIRNAMGDPGEELLKDTLVLLYDE